MTSDQPLRVLQVIPTIDPAIGGASHVAVNGAKSGSAVRIETTLVAATDRDSIESFAQDGTWVSGTDIRLLLFPEASRLGRRGVAWGLSPKLLVWILRNTARFDVVHLHYVWTLTTLVGAIRAKSLGIPVVLTGHESLTNYDIDVTSGSATKQRAKLLFRRVLMRNISIVVCASELEYEDSLNPGELGRVISHPIVEEIPVTSPKRPRGDFRLGYLGRLHPKKGLHRLLRAFAGLNDESAHLVICGEGDEGFTMELHRLAAALGVADQVEWRGHVDATERQKLFQSVDWMTMPSDYECFGMAGAEALAAGVPLITSSRTGIAPIVEEFECGIVVSPDSTTELKAAILRAASMDRDEVGPLREKALTASRENFTFDAYAQKIEELYRSVKS